MSGDRGNPPGEALAMTPSAGRWVCPVCRQAISPDADRPSCTGCGWSVFPRVGRCPFLADSRLQISAAAATLGVRRASLDAEIASLARAASDPLLGFRADPLERRRRNSAEIEPSSRTNRYHPPLEGRRARRRPAIDRRTRSTELCLWGT